ncbi:heme-binding domain-containing protein [Maribacter sp. M208]|uniref:heme-binding domain-containing protein n=1 Tax=Maribacter huludaoensis TaxID=3030010 RepID=UPI0023EB3308|nr:heme-binding domain-containing protein [Maribacter huludaoensis]MDF4222006.1 heme-binding domain-containing protein [Maribacter huludaoensis]
MKLIKKIGLVVVVVFIAMQFFSPTKNTAAGNHTSAFITQTNPTPELKNLFETSCYDCHSNNTKYPWYNNIAPISYLLADHVKEGKEHLNFSEWQNYSLDKKDQMLAEIEEEVVDGKMPLSQYTLFHKDTELTPNEVVNLVEWVRQTRIIYQLGKQPN